MRKIFKLTVYLVSLIIVISTNAFCLNANNIMHNPVDARSFKTPGLPLVIKAKLNGTRNVNHKIRLVAIIDGTAVDVTSNQVYWDEYDRPVYDFEIFYPRETLSYVFVMDEYVNMNLVSRSVSKRYTVNRLCKDSNNVESSDALQAVFEQTSIEERKEDMLEQIYNHLKWFNKRVENDE